LACTSNEARLPDFYVVCILFCFQQFYLDVRIFVGFERLLHVVIHLAVVAVEFPRWRWLSWYFETVPATPVCSTSKGLSRVAIFAIAGELIDVGRAF
jgi:hypothetical protein